MKSAQSILLSAGLATLVAAQGLDFAQINAAPTLASGPSYLDYDGSGEQHASAVTKVSITGVATAQVTKAPGRKLHKRSVRDDPNYTPYYPALATGYTTFPGPTTTTDAQHPCPTQPEEGTYCGFLNPLDPCAPQPDGYGPVPSPDTASAFLAYEPLHSMANAAPTNIPSTNSDSTYQQVFKDLNASVSAQSYIALYTFQTYDVNKCALYCDNTTLCTAFNIFAERDPSLNPSDNDSDAPTVWGYECPNPPSMTSFKCTLWGSSIDASLATNYGQQREGFKIVVTASDGYDKTNSTTPPDCSAPAGSSSSTVLSTSSTPATTLSTVLSSSSSSAAVTTSSSAAVTTSSSSAAVTTSSTFQAASSIPSSSTSALTTPTVSPSKPVVTTSTAVGTTVTASPSKPAVTTSSSSSTSPAKPTTSSQGGWNWGWPFPPYGGNKPTTTSANNWGKPTTSSTPAPVKPTTTSSPTPVKPTSTSSTSSTSSAPTCASTPWTWNQPKFPSGPWSHPSNCNSKGINAPKYHMGSQFFPGPFNPQVCSDYALAQNKENEKACKPTCQMFNAQYLWKNFMPFGTYCSLYSSSLDNSWATQGTQYSGWDRYDCQQSWTYTLQK